MPDKLETTASGYRIGAVSRLTGISPDTLRIWERRYAAVTPQRSAGGGRLYRGEDIARLKLMKQLVDAGDSIGTVATLGREELQARVAEIRPTAVPTAPLAPLRLVVIGEPLAARMQASHDTLTNVKVIASYNSPQAFLVGEVHTDADVLLIEQPTLQRETAVQVSDWMTRVSASHAVLVYRFAAQTTLQQLPQSRCSTLRAPADPKSIENHCVAVMGQHPITSRAEADDILAEGEPAPPRRYDDQTLARLATVSTTIKCECPRHLAELISGLSAFEQYSLECESRDPKDAALHAYLNATASRARHMIETALAQVMEAENITL